MLEPDESRLRIVPLTITSGPPAINVSEPITTSTGAVLELFVKEVSFGVLGGEVTTALLLVTEGHVPATEPPVESV